MEKVWIAAVFSIISMTFMYAPAEGQGPVDGRSNGQPVAGKVDEAAVASLLR